MNPIGRGRIEPGEKAAHAAGLPQFPIYQPPSRGSVAFRQVGKAVEQGSKIKAGSSDDHRQTASGGDFRNRISGNPSVLTRGVTVRRVQHV